MSRRSTGFSRVFRLSLALLLIALTATGCSLLERNASVRFQNFTDFNLFYGVKFGEAERLGYFGAGETSDYYDTPAGTYSLQAMDGSGSWLTISSSSMTVEGGKGYSIVGTGTGGYYYWYVVQDY